MKTLPQPGSNIDTPSGTPGSVMRSTWVDEESKVGVLLSCHPARSEMVYMVVCFAMYEGASKWLFDDGWWDEARMTNDLAEAINWYHEPLTLVLPAPQTPAGERLKKFFDDT
ncbi:MAG TPA: hypothetical protein VFT30_03055, partial [Nitrospira sp.]|nr:hypothetical protein [Nitrospira sp.]